MLWVKSTPYLGIKVILDVKVPWLEELDRNTAK